MYKKILAAAMALSITAALSGCGNNDSSSSKAQASSSQAQETTAAQTEPTTKSQEELKQDLEKKLNELRNTIDQVIKKSISIFMKSFTDELPAEQLDYFSDFINLPETSFYTIASDLSYIKVDSDPTDTIGLSTFGAAIASVIDEGLEIPESFAAKLQNTDDTYGVTMYESFSTSSADIKVEYSIDKDAKTGLEITYYITWKY